MVITANRPDLAGVRKIHLPILEQNHNAEFIDTISSEEYDSK